MSDGSRLILALDLVDVGGRALRMAQDISPHCFAIKVNWPIILHAGPQIIREISRFSRVICDLKLADIPNTNRLIVERVRELGAWGVIAHSFVGQDSLRAVVEAAGDMKVFSVVAMSHPPGASDLLNRFHDMLIDISMKAGGVRLRGPPGQQRGRPAPDKGTRRGGHEDNIARHRRPGRR